METNAYKKLSYQRGNLISESLTYFHIVAIHRSSKVDLVNQSFEGDLRITKQASAIRQSLQRAMLPLGNKTGLAAPHIMGRQIEAQAPRTQFAQSKAEEHKAGREKALHRPTAQLPRTRGKRC